MPRKPRTSSPNNAQAGYELGFWYRYPNGMSLVEERDPQDKTLTRRKIVGTPPGEPYGAIGDAGVVGEFRNIARGPTEAWPERVEAFARKYGFLRQPEWDRWLGKPCPSESYSRWDGALWKYRWIDDVDRLRRTLLAPPYTYAESVIADANNQMDNLFKWSEDFSRVDHLVDGHVADVRDKTHSAWRQYLRPDNPLGVAEFYLVGRINDVLKEETCEQLIAAPGPGQSPRQNTHLRLVPKSLLGAIYLQTARLFVSTADEVRRCDFRDCKVGFFWRRRSDQRYCNGSCRAQAAAARKRMPSAEE